MKNVVVGTAGHIDHGKTALVRALTGIDTDRLEEEKRRGISIDLGFAHANLSATHRIAFVDVPGHERFIKNMLAGAGGVDVVLFVIAADESIKPQTREHFEICRLLNIRSGVIALTKADLVDSDILGLARLEVEEFVTGSFLEGAPIIPVSAVTGQGIDALRAALVAAAEGASQRSSAEYFRLPIDRAFAIKGFGTVVTGTLWSGSVKLEQEVEAHPGARRLRVRGVQVHGESVKAAFAGQRTALNLAGIEATDLFRGMMLAEAGRYRETTQVDCSLELLPTAKPLKHRAPVHFHSGASEIEAEVRVLEGTSIQPGKRSYVRLILREPRLLLPGDRYILRMFSPVVTIGGGEVLDIDVPPQIRRPKALERLKLLQRASLQSRVELLVRESGAGLDLARLIARTGAREEAIAATTLPRVGNRFIDPEWLNSIVARWRSQLADFHRTNPLLPGMPKEHLRSREFADTPPELLDAILGSAKDIVAKENIVHLASHKIAFKADEEQALRQIESAFEQAGLSVPALQEVLAASGVESGRARSLLQILLRQRKLVKIGDDLVFHHSAMDALRQNLAARKGEKFKVPDFKEWTGISRKYAIPLLEYMDRERVTRRDGDFRVVL